jgi:hypothetical protein
MERTALNAEMKGHIDRMRELVNTADGQVQVAADAHSRGESRSLESAHRGLGVTIRSMHRTLKSIGEAGEKADHDANTKTQNSGGMGEGTSGRGSPLYTQGNAGIGAFLDRARQGSRRS